MKMLVCSILDTKAKAYGQLLVFNNVDMCKRAMSNPLPADNEMAKWPDDFVMMHVGDFDTDNGVLVGCSPQIVGTFAEYQQKG